MESRRYRLHNTRCVGTRQEASYRPSKSPQHNNAWSTSQTDFQNKQKTYLENSGIEYNKQKTAQAENGRQ